MAIAPYLAMMETEIALTSSLPEQSAYIFCPFCKGTINLPESISANSLLVLTDQYAAGPEIADDLIRQILASRYRAVLLDFQKPNNKDTFAFTKKLLKTLPCPVIVSDLYAKELDCPVFLRPLPLHTRLTDHTQPWLGRDIWLDISAEAEQITLTEEGSRFAAISSFLPQEPGHQENNLHCHYSISVVENSAAFTLWRSEEDLKALLDEAESCGIKGAVGLYQELGDF